MSKKKLSEFNFDLPKELIAKYPIEDRDEARLMVVHKSTGKIEHKTFKDLVNYFDEDDVLIRNDTKVFPARLYGNKEKTGSKIEVFLLRELNRNSFLWDVLVDPARKIRIGNKLYFGDDESLVAEVIDNTTSRGRTLRFLFENEYAEFKKQINAMGKMPLPPLIDRQPEEIDTERFQTIYAKAEGAVAVPSAGLNFSKHLLKKLELKGVDFADITLHIGVGTYRQVEVEDLTKHRIDSEEMLIPKKTAEIVNNAIENKRRICVVGTSSMRAIESSISTYGLLKPFKGWTNKFIFPPYTFNVANALLTGFHTPGSTHLMQTAAFLGYDNGAKLILKIYKTAIKEGYRFYTYGDSMLIID